MMTATPEALRQHREHEAVRARLWGKDRVINIVEEQRRASEIMEDERARARREAEMQVLKRRLSIQQARQRIRDEEERAKYRRQQLINDRRIAREALKRERERDEAEAKTLVGWDVIGPTITNGTMEEIAAQVLAHFPWATFEYVIDKGKSKKRAHIMRMFCIALRKHAENATVMEIGNFIRREHSTVSCYIRTTHLYEDVVKRPKPNKIAPQIDVVREMFFAGARHKDIADRIGSAQSAVTRFINRQGWKRENA